MLALLPVDRPEPVGYMNVFEEGDVWLKINNCFGCENSDKCCGRCEMLVGGDCRLHLEGWGKGKPYHCTVWPPPNIKLSFCQLAFKCVKGSNEGKIKRINSNKIE
jgi:hypothetical protein